MLNPEVKCKFCHHKISIDDNPDIEKETLLEASTIMTKHLKNEHEILILRQYEYYVDEFTLRLSLITNSFRVARFCVT